jgi:hypothetical protein
MPMPLTIFLDRRDDLLEQLVALLRDVINLWLPTTSSGIAVGELCLTLPLRGHGHARDLLPDLEALTHPLGVLGGGEPVSFRSEVLADGTIHGEKTLCVL